MFFQNFKETADKLPDDLRLKFYDAMLDYVFNDVETDDPVVNALITAIKPSLDKVDQRGGAREGAGRKSNEIKNNQKQPNEIKNNQNNQSFQETETETRNGNIETETEDEKENAKEKVTIITPFDEFWSFYPKQRAGSKEKARIAFQRAVNEHRATAEQIIASCKVYAKSDEVARGFAKGAAAWLNDDRFNNDYTPPKTKQQIAFEKAYGELQELYNEDDHESEVANVG